MKTTNFSSSDEASQYLVNSGAPRSRLRPTDDGKVETLITYADRSQEVLISPPTTRTLEESLARLKAIIEEKRTKIRVHPLTIDGVIYPGNLDGWENSPHS